MNEIIQKGGKNEKIFSKNKLMLMIARIANVRVEFLSEACLGCFSSQFNRGSPSKGGSPSLCSIFDMSDSCFRKPGKSVNSWTNSCR